MTIAILAKVEDRPTPKAVYNWRVYACACVAGSAAIMIGYDSAFIGTTIALPSFRSEFAFDSLSKADVNLLSANVVSCYQAGAFFGAISAYLAGFYWGRKIGMAIYAAIFMLGAGMMCGANAERGLGLIYAGRVLAGIGVGGASGLSPIYISEISPPAIRGRLVCMFELGWQIGGLVGFWINYGLVEHVAPSHKQWLIPFAVQLIPAGMLLVGCLWLPESPRWLMLRGRREQAIKNLTYIRQLSPSEIYMKEELYAIDESIDSQRETVGLGFWQPFKALARDKKVMYRFFLGGSLFFWQNTSGINAINYYSPTVFKSMGINGTNTGLFTTGLFGVVKTAFTFLYLLFMIETVGRRRLLMIGALGGGLCLWYVGAYIAIAKPSTSLDAKLTPAGTSAVFFFYLWTAFYSPTWNPTPWVYNSEMFDNNHRALAQAFAAANNWFWNFIVARFTPQMFATMNYGVYFFFAALMMCSCIFVFFLMPETKGIPLESMNRLFSNELTGGFRTRKAHKRLLAELAEEERALRAGMEEKEGIEGNLEQQEVRAEKVAV